MKRYRQTFEEIKASLARIESSWMNAHAGEVIMTLKGVPKKKRYGSEDIIALLDADFMIGFTVIRLFIDQSHSRQVKAEIPDSTGEFRLRLSLTTCLGSGSKVINSARLRALMSRTARRS